MPLATGRSWSDLSPSEQERLDERYLRELEQCAEPGVTERGLELYLNYRHERPEAQITTYEEGQIRRMLRPYIDRSRLPDPASLQEHTGTLESFGAKRLHMTNEKFYVAIMFTLTLLFVVALFVTAFMI